MKAVLSGISRKDLRPPAQAQGITERKLLLIETVASIQRGRERKATAERRGAIDVALISLMRDRLLRRSEVAAIEWSDITKEDDGSGRLWITRSKTDQEGQGAVGYVSPQTIEKLELIRSTSSGPVFTFNERSVTRRIAEAARAAKLPGKYSGHSPRIGMAQDLARAGASLNQMMTAGRWKSHAMPARYTVGEEADRGAVAIWYAGASVS